MRKEMLALMAAVTLAGCAVDGDKIITGSLKPQDERGAKPKRPRAEAAQPVSEAAEPRTDGRKAYCADIRKTWKPGDMPTSDEALQKRKADNIYCSG